MMALNKIVDKILKIEPSLQDRLIPIKDKWERSNKVIYWKQLLEVLNVVVPKNHPKRLEIQRIFTKKPRTAKKIQTFELPSPAETVVGVLPEQMDCRIRRYDRLQIVLSKNLLEARMTRNTALAVETMRRYEKLDLKQKQVWMNIKDHFNLWKMDDPTSFFIREQNHLLVLTSIKMNGSGGGNGVLLNPSGDPDNLAIRLDPEMLKKFLKMFGLNPPPGFLPPPTGQGLNPPDVE